MGMRNEYGERMDEIAENICDNCESENVAGQVICAVCGLPVKDN